MKGSRSIPGRSSARPRESRAAAIVYLAHLSEEERQFVVTLVLSKLVTWMRGQPGTSDLRTLVYMDEVFGFVPPTAAPPAKKPILTVFKQGRAFGVGMVLATQNPVDLDYKAMSNAGTWLVGRLQTERDKARVLEGLKSAAGGADIDALDTAIGGLDKRQFLLVSAKSSEPALFGTRWAMSYLRGPLTRDQMAELMKGAARPRRGASRTARRRRRRLRRRRRSPSRRTPAPSHRRSPTAPRSLSSTPPPPWAEQIGAVAGGTRLSAFLAARVSVRFDDSSADVDEQEEYEALYGPLEDGLDLTTERAVDYDDRDLAEAPPAGATYVLPGAKIGESSFFRDAERDVKRHLVDARPLELLRNRELKLVSRPGETPEQFAERCDQAAQEAEDAEAAKIRDKLEAKQDKLEQALELARRRVEELDADARADQADDFVAGAGELLGALLGGRRSTRSITTALGRATSGTSVRAAERRETALTKVQHAQDTLAELELEIAEELQEIDAEWTEKAAAIETVSIRAEATDVRVLDLRLVWVPTA